MILGDIFVKSGKSFQSLVVDGKKLSMYDVVLFEVNKFVVIS